MKLKYIVLLVSWLFVNSASSQSLLDNLDGKVEMQGSFASGSTPLWLNANKYGLSSLDEANGYVRAAVIKPTDDDSNTRKWGVGYGADIAVTQGFSSRFVVQQAYVEGRWLKGSLTVGSKEVPMELKDNNLSSGSQALGINARPVPQLRLALNDYWAIPVTHGWVSLKGHLAYGITTDGNWQEDFTGGNSKYSKNVLYHSKAGYIKIGNDYKFCPWSIELGLEMATQFGGKTHLFDDDGNWIVVEGGHGVKDFFNAFIGSGSDVIETKYKNVEGNTVGSYVARFNYDADAWKLGIYVDHFFEDHSGMFLADYDGYGKGEEWNVKKDSKFFIYDLKDIMLGADLELKECYWLRKIVFEYLYTKYQSGPIYHDHTMSISDHVGGQDHYYNHTIYGAWQHWGQVIGNPLYRSPIYNDDGTINVDDNRFYAFHLGLSGSPAENLDYKVLATYQKGFGTYSKPYLNPKENISLMAQVDYSFTQGKWAGAYISCGVGADIGKIYGDNIGVQLTVGKKFKIKK